MREEICGIRVTSFVPLIKYLFFINKPLIETITLCNGVRLTRSHMYIHVKWKL